ncbi:hypothetical protein VTN02DRAFT_5283 [Thermoascus thermophilus]
MAEEPQLQTIQQRIAALNSAQVGLNPNVPPRPQPAPKPPAVRHWTVNKPVHEANGSVADRASIGNESTGLRQELLPPPVITRTGQKTPDNPDENPSPLPLRPKSSPRSPALPPRRPSAQFERRGSRESITSAASRSTTSTGTSRDRLRAPPWEEAELPPLPPKREARSPAPKPKPPPRASTSPVPPLPPRRVSSSGSGGNDPSAPKLPPRRPSGDQSSQSVNSTNVDGARPPQRKLPPPPPSAAALDKIRQSSFAGLSKHEEAPPIPARPTSNGVQRASVPNNMPPAVPTASPPDLSKLLATKPRFIPSAPSTVPAPSSTVCLKCRDFSGPDTHAAQFPRQSLPSHDLRWLASQLTGPFPSPTDKARAIFTWLHYNVRYDVYSFFNNCVQPSTPEKTLASGLAVCEGYAGLFAALATHAGLEAVVISGHGKGYGYQDLAPGSPLPPFESNHAWNAVKIDGGYWKLIDSCWGAGALEGQTHTYNQRFDPNQFTMSNDDFGLRHYPTNKNQFYRDDGRPSISWEEYILGDPSKPSQSPLVYHTSWEEHGIGESTFLPAAKRISVHQSGPIRFQFSLICEHWTVERHSKKSGPCVFLLLVHGIDGRQDDRIPFNHVRGSAPGGGGDFWYVDIADPRLLGAPGQKLHVAALTSFGDRKDARGLTVQEYRDQVGRVGMAWAHIAEWELV